jgi:hypothetical protein
MTRYVHTFTHQPAYGYSVRVEVAPVPAPCPRCRSTAVRVVNEGWSGSRYRVDCFAAGCERSGKWRKSPAAARRVWAKKGGRR